MQKLKYYEGVESTEIDKAAERIYNKLQIINTEYVQWLNYYYAFVLHNRIYGTALDISIPSKDETIRNGR